MLSPITASQIIAFLALTASCTVAVPLTVDKGNTTDYTTWLAENPGLAIRNEGLQKRAGGLYACNARDFSNSEGCVRIVPSIGRCANLPNGFVDRVSSIGPDEDLICSLFDNSDCQRNQKQIDNVVTPGFGYLNIVAYGDGGSWEDRIASYICFRN